MAATSKQPRREAANIMSALEASLAGVVVMALFAYLIAPALRLPAVDLPLLAPSTLAGPGAGDLILAVLKLWPVGIAAGLLYAYGVAPFLPWAGWLKGLVFGLALFLLLSIIAMPLAGLLHPSVAGEQSPLPGLLGLGLGGWLVPLVVLGDHLVFGIVLGTIYRPGPRTVAWAEGRDE
jgi:hypothetical protein